MKTIIATIAAMLLTVSGFAQSGRNIYNKYSDEAGVSAVFVSPAMFRLMGKIPDLDMGNEGVDISPVIKSLNGFYLIDSENQKVSESIQRDVDRMVKSGNYELLMETKDEGESVHIYTTGNAADITGFVLMAYEKTECTFICLDGRIPREQFENLIANASKTDLKN